MPKLNVGIESRYGTGRIAKAIFLVPETATRSADALGRAWR